jgi:DNA mismatch endonuclease, patch repair protein
VPRETAITPARSALMARVRQRHTEPELVVRSLLHRLGLRFTVSGRLNQILPSRPDIVLPKWKTVVLVHGCFWHRHVGCVAATTPKTRREFWIAKFDANVARDKKQRRKLRGAGWRVITIWECETRTPDKLRRRLRQSFPRTSF